MTMKQESTLVAKKKGGGKGKFRFHPSLGFIIVIPLKPMLIRSSLQYDFQF